MSSNSIVIDFNGEEWEVDFYYYPGTRFMITSASLEPNDPEEMEIEDFRHHTLPMSYEFLSDYLEKHQEEIEQLVWEYIKGKHNVLVK